MKSRKGEFLELQIGVNTSNTYIQIIQRHINDVHVPSGAPSNIRCNCKAFICPLFFIGLVETWFLDPLEI